MILVSACLRVTLRRVKELAQVYITVIIPVAGFKNVTKIDITVNVRSKGNGGILDMEIFMEKYCDLTRLC